MSMTIHDDQRLKKCEHNDGSEKRSNIIRTVNDLGHVVIQMTQSSKVYLTDIKQYGSALGCVPNTCALTNGAEALLMITPGNLEAWRSPAMNYQCRSGALIGQSQRIATWRKISAEHSAPSIDVITLMKKVIAAQYDAQLCYSWRWNSGSRQRRIARNFGALPPCVLTARAAY